MAPSIKSIMIDTGNIFNLDIIQHNNALLNPGEEVVQGIKHILKEYCNEKCEASSVQILDQNVTYIASGQDLSEGHERNKLKLTVKLFLYPQNHEQNDEASLKREVDEAITSMVQLLNVGYVNNLILSIQESQEDRVMPFLKSAWSTCGAYTQPDVGRKIRSLGTSDLNRDQLRELFQASNIKPKSSQINLDACCDVPEDLAAFAKDNSIKLLTHNDPLSDFVPVAQVRSVFDSLKAENDNCKLLKQIIPADTANLQRKWVARYTTVLASQGVLLTKGYLVSLSDSKQ